MPKSYLIDSTINDILGELDQALRNHPAMPTCHDGWAVIYEELDELWDIVKKKPSERDYQAMRKEAIQVAAMAMRFILDVCDTKAR
jgi:hypothetical protein